MVDFSKGVNDEDGYYLIKRMRVTPSGSLIEPRYLCVDLYGRYRWYADYCYSSVFVYKEVLGMLNKFDNAHVSRFVYYKVFYY